ncbi:MAG: nitroreductase family deazaflavin-dependent oxidoreductase [Methanothrix sp.]|nr:nitroreductase/quinone reductase family protein [Methanothrix sp.]MCX8207490.1 nitroreductase family deazaflavin-dependent oxidoreductase [Methanothrix sp.]
MSAWVYRLFFRLLNSFLILPAFRIGLGRMVSNPITGRVMVLILKGRKSGRTRYTPVGYAIINGKIYCYRGERSQGAWYLNLLAEPHIEVMLPGGRIKGHAEEVADDEEKFAALREILKNGGLSGFVYGFNPWTVDEDVLRERMRGVRVVRINPAGPLT